MAISKFTQSVKKIFARSIPLTLSYFVFMQLAVAGTASGQAQVTFELYVVNAVESGTSNPVDVVLGASFFYSPATEVTSGTGDITQTQMATLRGSASSSVIPREIVGPSGVAFSTPNVDPATVADTFKLISDATIPGGSYDADAANNINAVIDIVNENAFNVDVTFAIVASITGSATTDGVVGDDASASSNITVSSTSGDFAAFNLSGDDLDGCITMPSVDSYCETFTLSATTVTLFENDAIFIDPVGGNTAFAFATGDAPATPDPVNVPMPIPALLLMGIMLAVFGCRYSIRNN